MSRLETQKGGLTSKNERTSEQDQAEQQDQQLIKGSQRSDGTFRKDIQIREGYTNMFDSKKYTIPQRRRMENMQNDSREGVRAPQMKQEIISKNNQANNNQSLSWRNGGNTSYDKQDRNKQQIGSQSKQLEPFKQGDFPDIIGLSAQTNNHQKEVKDISKKTEDCKKPNQIKEEKQNHKSNVEDQNTKLEKPQQVVSSSIKTIPGLQQLFKNSNEKEKKKLCKKLREIEQLEQKQREGMELLPEAIEKISKKEEILKLITDLS